MVAAWEAATQAVLDDPEYKAAYEGANLRAEFIPHDEYVTFIETFGSETESFLKETGVIE